MKQPARIEPLLITTTEAAQFLGIGRGKLAELIKSGDIKVVRIGRAVRVPVAELREFLERLQAK